MTKKEALDLYLMYDLEPFYAAILERRLGVAIPSNLTNELKKKCFLIFHDEVRNMSKKEWEKELNDE